jgi:hypothetical protein
VETVEMAGPEEDLLIAALEDEGESADKPAGETEE